MLYTFSYDFRNYFPVNDFYCATKTLLYYSLVFTGAMPYNFILCTGLMLVMILVRSPSP